MKEHLSIEHHHTSFVLWVNSVSLGHGLADGVAQLAHHSSLPARQCNHVDLIAAVVGLLHQGQRKQNHRSLLGTKRHTA